MENRYRIFAWLHEPNFRARLAHTNPQAQPHRALLEPMYLMACYFTSSNPEQSLEKHEAHFLERSRHALEDSLAYSDRLMDFLQGSVLVTAYLFLRGRFLEGCVHVCRSGLFYPDVAGHT